MQDTEQYLMIVEATGSGGGRYFPFWTSTGITGPWKALADTEGKPFAGRSNVTSDGGAWTEDISHGEVARATNDQNLTVPRRGMQYLYQGRSPPAGGNYNTLPWKLGLLTRTGPTC